MIETQDQLKGGEIGKSGFSPLLRVGNHPILTKLIGKNQRTLGQLCKHSSGK